METKLNLGCGNDVKDGFINVDTAGGKGVIPQDIINYLIGIQRETVDHIMLKDSLEHLPHGLIDVNGEVVKDNSESISAEFALKHCHRVLKKGGTIYIRVPDAEWIISQWSSGQMDWKRFVWTMLGSIKNTKYDTHKAMWTIPNMEKLLLDIGFTDISIEQEHPNMTVRAKK